MAEERAGLVAQAAGVLKKIIASRGALLGVFYVVVDGQGKDAVLVATLASKDKQGARAINQGRPYRKLLKGSRFARGEISLDERKLIFTIHQGTANKKGVQAALRELLSEEKGLTALKKALVRMASGDEEDTSQEAGEALGQELLQEADEGSSAEELRSLVEVQGDLSLLRGAFLLSDAEVETAWAGEVGQTLARLKEAQAADPVDEEAQQGLRSELAVLLSVAQGDLPALGEVLSPELQQVLLAADTLLEDEGVPWRQERARWLAACVKVEQQLGGLGKALRETGNPALIAIATYDLGAMLREFQAELSSTLQPLEAQATPLSHTVTAARKGVVRLQRSIRTDPRVTACEQNPAKIPVQIRANLLPALSALEKALSTT